MSDHDEPDLDDRWPDDRSPDDRWQDDPAEVWRDDGVAPTAPVGGAYLDPGAPPAGDLYADEYVDYRPPMSRAKRLALTGGLLVALVVVVAGGLWMWIQGQIDPSGPPGEPIDLEVVAGATTEDIGMQLADAGVITNASVWNYYTRFKDEGPFQAGEYVFQLNSSFGEAIAVLEAGPRAPESFRVTIPEGLTVAETLARLSDPDRGIDGFDLSALEAALASGQVRSNIQPPELSSFEGFLFPETYEVADDADERSFLQRLVTQLDETMLQLDAINGSAALGITPYELLIVASLIEEEAKIDEDRPKIARVIYNRLEQGIPLGIDATNRYEAILAGRDRDDLDFDSDSPYNTRKVRGLPPTPIASPGFASLRAALDPEPGDWIFYVLQTETEHFFTNSNAEFLRAKEACRRNGLGCG